MKLWKTEASSNSSSGLSAVLMEFIFQIQLKKFIPLLKFQLANSQPQVDFYSQDLNP